MTQERIPTAPSPEGDATPTAPTHERAPAAPKAGKPRLRTGVRAGDVYMQWPRGSNNRLNSLD